MTARARSLGGVCLAGALLVTGCATLQGQQGGSSVPQITVSGQSDPQTSLAPGQVAAARKAAGIADCPDTSQASAAGSVGGTASTAADAALPHVVLECLGGDRTVDLAGLPKGRPYVINVWAQWCWPCTQEAPFLGEVWKGAKGKVDFIGINYQDPSPGKAIDFAKKFGLTYPELSDPKSSSKVPLRIGVIPQTFFVDAHGRVVHREIDSFGSADELRQMIKQYLGVVV